MGRRRGKATEEKIQERRGVRRKTKRKEGMTGTKEGGHRGEENDGKEREKNYNQLGRKE